MTSLHTMLGVLSRLPAMRVGCTRWSTVLPRYARPLAVQGVNLLHVHAHPCLAQDMQPGFYAAEAGGFDETGLKSDVVAHIQTAGFERPSFIQAKGMAEVLAGHDVIISAETGSGKTLTYLAGVLEDLVEHGHEPRAADDAQPPSLILVPSVDLVQQVARTIHSIVPGLPDGTVAEVYGKRAPTRQDPVRVLVATPKALQENVRYQLLAGLKRIIVDEADILIGGPLTASLQYVLSHMKLRDVARRPQHVFAAATIPHNGKKSVRKWLQRYYPDAVEVTTPLLHHANPKLTQLIVQVGDEHDPEDSALIRNGLLLAALQGHLLAAGAEPGKAPTVVPAQEALASAAEGSDKGSQLRVPVKTLVFVSSVGRAVETLAFLKEQDPDLGVDALHKRVSLDNRAEVLRRFNAGELQVLVCTDLGARGIDFSVDHVVQLDFATDAVAYIHRIGRTARAGSEGFVTSFADTSNSRLLEVILDAGDGSLDGTFSRRRSLGRKHKRDAKRAKAKAEGGEGGEEGQ